MRRRSLLKGLEKSLQSQNYHAYNFSSKPTNTSTNIPSQINHVSEIARERFDSWDAVVSILDQGSLTAELIYKASKLLNSGTKPDGYYLVYLVRASTDLGFVSYCRQLHGYILKSGFGSNVFVSTVLVRFYRVVGAIVEAHKMFDEITQPNVVSWNSLISGYVRSGKFGKALDLFYQLDRCDVVANAYSFTLALSACGQGTVSPLGRSLHGKIVKYGLECGVVVGNCLIDMYGKSDSVEEAIQVFNEMVCKDNFSWNSVIAASARNRRLELAYSFFCRMPKPDTISYNELINGISQFGNVEDAVEILSNMPNPNSSSWNAIITGYVNRKRMQESLEFFTKMHSKDIIMDEYTFSILLSGIAGFAALRWGMLIHSCTIKWGLDASVVVGSALIDMYSKCGHVKDAESMFRSLPGKNLVTWNAMILGYAYNGNPRKVIDLFMEMKGVKDLKPDWVTFLNVLAACSNCDVPLQNSIRYFESMINDYGIEPTVQHCCSMIRLMGQIGEVQRAGRMIYDLSFGYCAMVWKTLLSVCGACGDLKVASIAAAKVIELEGDDDYVYVTLSNIYACYSKWVDASKVRKLMRERGVRKEVGCSWI